MSDIVERLCLPISDSVTDEITRGLRHDAANEIKRLRAEKAELLKTRDVAELQQMINYWGRRAEKAEVSLLVLERQRREAADEIERLRAFHESDQECTRLSIAEVERLREEMTALVKIAARHYKEIERLRAERDELLAALKLAVDEYRLGYSENTMMAIRAAIVKTESGK
jgi:chromosome segregation ATPase